MILKCDCCLKEFKANNRHYNHAIKRNQKRFFCSLSCSAKAKVRPPKKNIDNEALRIRRIRENEKRRLKRMKEKEAIKNKQKDLIKTVLGEHSINLPIGLII